MPRGGLRRTTRKGSVGAQMVQMGTGHRQRLKLERKRAEAMAKLGEGNLSGSVTGARN